MKESLMELIDTDTFKESIVTVLRYSKIGDAPKVGSVKAARIIGMSRSWVSANKEILHAEKVILPTGKVKWLYDSSKIIGYLNEYRQRNK